MASPSVTSFVRCSTGRFGLIGKALLLLIVSLVSLAIRFLATLHFGLVLGGLLGDVVCLGHLRHVRVDGFHGSVHFGENVEAAILFVHCPKMLEFLHHLLGSGVRVHPQNLTSLLHRHGRAFIHGLVGAVLGGHAGFRAIYDRLLVRLRRCPQEHPPAHHDQVRYYSSGHLYNVYVIQTRRLWIALVPTNKVRYHAMQQRLSQMSTNKKNPLLGHFAFIDSNTGCTSLTELIFWETAEERHEPTLKRRGFETCTCIVTTKNITATGEFKRWGKAHAV
mmetsp:Transcript_23824/g.39943  ORF Transcript_23824/g.39943 Transcript_23824/m.39943 type:complete len:277 (-) Transcript_23824:51-881(-)